MVKGKTVVIELRKEGLNDCFFHHQLLGHMR